MLLSDLEKLVECPVCQQVKEESPRQCDNGHLICEDCISFVNDCPICRIPYNHLPARNLTAKQIIAALDIPIDCPQKCGKRLQLGERLCHEAHCTERIVQCPWGCDESLRGGLKMSELKAHAEACHAQCVVILGNNRAKKLPPLPFVVCAHSYSVLMSRSENSCVTIEEISNPCPNDLIAVRILAETTSLRYEFHTLTAPDADPICLPDSLLNSFEWHIDIGVCRGRR